MEKMKVIKASSLVCHCPWRRWCPSYWPLPSSRLMHSMTCIIRGWARPKRRLRPRSTLSLSFFSVMITKEGEAAAVLSFIFKGRSILKKGHFFSKVEKPSPKPIQTLFPKCEIEAEFFLFSKETFLKFEERTYYLDIFWHKGFKFQCQLEYMVAEVIEIL